MKTTGCIFDHVLNSFPHECGRQLVEAVIMMIEVQEVLVKELLSGSHESFVSYY